MKQSDPFRGIFTIPSTPFHQSGEIDAEGLRSVIDFCIECGAHGLVYPVNASEFTHLSDAERFELTRVLVEHNAGRIPAIVGVAGLTKEVAAKFAADAKSIGADGVIAMPPYVRKSNLSLDGVFDYYQSISDSGGLPIFIQNYSPPIGTDLSAEFMMKLIREIEHVDYIKEETVPCTQKLTRINELNADGACKGVFGGAGGRYMIEEFRRGTSGNMPGCHVTDVVVGFWNALDSGDETRGLEYYKELAPLFFYETQLPGTYKEVLKRRGVIECAYRRNDAIPTDDIGSKYLDDILEVLTPLMSWGK